MESKRFLAKDSITTQLIKIVFGLYCVVAVVVTVAQIIAEYNHTKSQIRQELSINQQIFEPVLSAGLWNLDDEQIQNTINGMLAIPIVTGVKIEQNGQLYRAVGKIVDDNNIQTLFDKNSKLSSEYLTQDQEIFSFGFTIHYNFRGQRREVGYATIYSDNSTVISRVEMGILLLIINSIIKTLALWVLFFYVGKRVLVKPLQQLTQAIKQVNFEHLDRFRIDLKINRQNELSQIQTAFEQMVEELAQARLNIIELNNNLEATVAKRTLDLRLAKEDAELASQAKTIFMSRINHELRTPLNAIIGCSQILQQNLSAPEHSNELKLVNHNLDAAEHLLMLFEDIMDVIILSGKEVSISLAPCELDPIISASIAMVENQARENNISISAQPSQLSAYANSGRLKQVLLNLLTNAIKYNRPNGNVKITVYPQHQDDRIKISVKDSGVGINPNDLETIFEPMTRLTYAEQQCIDGSGIGLSIAKSLVEKMNGQLTVSSELGQGSEFVITLATKSTVDKPE